MYYCETVRLSPKVLAFYLFSLSRCRLFLCADSTQYLEHLNVLGMYIIFDTSEQKLIYLKHSSRKYVIYFPGRCTHKRVSFLATSQWSSFGPDKCVSDLLTLCMQCLNLKDYVSVHPALSSLE